MSILIITISIFFFFIAPFYLKKLNNKLPAIDLLSDVVVCFGIGILLGNTQNWWLPNELIQQTVFKVAETNAAATVLLAIPMLLMTSDIRDCLRYAPKFMFSFILGVLSVLIAAFLVVYWFPDLPNVKESAGCLTGVYIGGTPNMVAISYALATPDELFVILNSTDLFCSGIYFFFLTSVAKTFYGWFLPPFISQKEDDSTKDIKANLFLDTTPFPPQKLDKQSLYPLFTALFWAIISIGISVIFAFLFPNAQQELNEMVLMVVLSSVSIGLSFYRKIQELKGVYEFAQYLLLIFAVSVGFMVDFEKLVHVADSYLVFNAVMVILLLLIHLILAKIFKIDVDTFMISSTACVFGPAFIGQVCSAIKNKEMLAPGMALGVLGLIIGTYFGILVAGILE